MQVLPFVTLLTLGFRKAAFIAATAAAAERLQVMVVVGIFVQVSHFCVRKAENETTYKCTTYSQHFDTKIAPNKGRFKVVNNTVV
jgi:hypothetical protein